ncbi:hypothetical protein [Kribbella sp. VKM Ac-2568]|uniref:hypothetical protein n=1 Tax=Kribbella sp. VKM Ac-2568 TaxID=2512219 RepID=UPI001047112A|nr:hypothetical protein [Kribbella sp. VKM Ac-2568]TCM35119.1 hypothetical protein EV648_12512 [Kribbella sp. VKM Ac-2568]
MSILTVAPRNFLDRLPTIGDVMWPMAAAGGVGLVLAAGLAVVLVWPLDAAKAARSACLQTIRDGLLSASDLAALLPAAGRLSPGELLALVDSAALGLTAPTAPAEATGPDGRATAPTTTAPFWLVAYLLGALRVGSPAPVHDTTRTDLPAPVQQTDRVGASAPVHAPHRTDTTDVDTAAPAKPTPSKPRARRSDDDDLTELRRVSDTDHGGAPLPQREIMRVLNCGFPKARRLADLAGWLDPDAARPASGDDQHPETPTNNPSDTDDQTSTDRELETSSSR